MVTKVERSGLLPVVATIVDEDPDISHQEVANILMRDYSDKLKDGKITWYAIRNVRQKLNESNIKETLNEEESVQQQALEDFTGEMKQGAEEAKQIVEEARQEGDLSVALKGLEQIRKNWTSMMEHYKKNVAPAVQNITVNEDKKVLIQLRQYNELLCPNCKERIHREMLLEHE